MWAALTFPIGAARTALILLPIVPGLALILSAVRPFAEIVAPALGGFDYSNATKGELIATVGTNELPPEYLKALRDLGQSVKEEDAYRGYWIGASIDAKTGERHGAAPRDLRLGGSVAGY